MNASEILQELADLASPQIKSIYLRHGAQEPIFGVKTGDLKIIQKRIKTNHALSLELYSTGNGDAMYLAGLIADEKNISKSDLETWAKHASSPMIAEYTVAGVAAESGYGWELGLKWIDRKQERIASAGWAALAHCLSLSDSIDTKAVEMLLSRIEKTIHSEQNRVRHTMNNFVIAVGSYVPALNERAKRAARTIGQVEVFMGETACKVPDAIGYIEKVEKAGKLGKKKKQARC